MDAGLSVRAQKTLHDLLPSRADTAPPAYQSDAAAAAATADAAIDLAGAQNEVLHPELLELFKTTVEDHLTTKALALPDPCLLGAHVQLRQALASFFNAHLHPVHAVRQEHIVLTAGADDALETLIHAVCDDGDSLLVPGPYWYGLEHIAKSRPNVNIILAQPPTYENYDNYLLPSLQAAYDFSADNSRIKAVLVCNPHNPLGRCYPRHALLELMEFCQERGLHLIANEVFALTELSDIPPKAPDFASALSLTEPLVPEGAVKVDPSRVHVVWSPSKLFGLSGLRIGCLISQQNPSLLSALSLLTPSHIPPISSLLLSSLLSFSQLNTFLKLNTERLTLSYRHLSTFLRQHSIPFVAPTHGNFVFAKLATAARCAADEEEFYAALAEQGGVVVAQGMLFRGVEGDYGWARVRFAVDSGLMEEVVARLEKFLRGRK